MLIPGLTGLLAFLLLHLLFLSTWSDLFAVRPWPGYEAATASGIVEPWFVHSPRSLWLTRGVYLALGLVVAQRAGNRPPALLALWTGAAAGTIFVWATTTMRAMSWGWLGFVLYPLRLLAPVLAGWVLSFVIDRVRARG